MPNIVQNLSLTNRPITLVLRMIAIGFFATLGSHASAADYLTAELNSTTALRDVLQAKQQLLKARRAAIETLASEGHASTLERVAASQSLTVVRQQISVCTKHIELLQKLQTDATGSRSSEFLIFDPAALNQLPTRLPFIVGSEVEDENLRSRLQHVEAVHAEVITTLAEPIRRQIGLLRETRQKLNALDSETSAEIQFIDRKMTVMKAELVLLGCRPASLRLVSVPTSIPFDDGRVSSQKVVSMVSTHWNKNMLDAQRDTNLMLADSMRKFFTTESVNVSGWLPKSSDHRLAKRTYDQAKLQARLMQEISDNLQRELDSLEESPKHSPLMTDVRSCSELMALFADLYSSPRELKYLASRVSALSSRNANDEQNRQEYRWAAMRHQSAIAENQQRQLLAQTILSPIYQSTAVALRNRSNASQSFLAHFCNGKVEQARFDQSLAASTLAAARQEAIRQLHSEGYASWKELRSAEVEAMNAQDQVVVANLQITSSRLRQRILDRIWSQAEPADKVATITTP